MATPTLLLRPEGSRDRSGPVVPSIIGSPPIVTGAHGQAWRTTSADRISVPNAAYLVSSTYTALVRATYRAYVDDTQFTYTFTANGTNGVQFGRNNKAPYQLLGFSGGGNASIASGPPQDLSSVIGQRFDGSVLRLIYNGTIGAATPVSPPNLGAAPIVAGSSASTSTVDVESVLLFGVALSDAEIDRISTMPTAWTWENVSASPHAASLNLGMVMSL